MKTLVTACAALALLAAPAAGFAQTAPASTAPVPSGTPMTMAPAPSTAPASATTAPATAPATSAPATTSPSTGAPHAMPAAGPAKSSSAKANANANKLAHVKKLQSGTLSFSDARYGITHPAQEIAQLRKLKTVSFDKLRVYRLSSGLKSMLKIGDRSGELEALALLGPPVVVAQTSSNGNNSPMAMLQYVLANINVSNALNNVSVLNGANVNVGVSLADVLNANKISIGQVAGIFVNGLGVITTITK